MTNLILIDNLIILNFIFNEVTQMIKRPHILITNDDGIYAPGIKHLWKALKGIADLTIVAPSTEQSAVSLSSTIRHPLKIEQIAGFDESKDVWAVNGTPSDCVKLALNIVLSSAPDLIVSGINRGSNAGRNVWYSGTVAAIIEGTIQNIPGIAFSLGEYFQPSFDHLEPYIPAIVQYVFENPLPEATFLNVNFPSSSSTQEIKGMRMTRQGKQYWAENPERRHHPVEGHAYYWLGSKLAEFDEEEESDIRWLQKGFATAVPIFIGDLSNRHHISTHKRAFEEYMDQSFSCLN